VSVITDISLDHMEWLGSTLREITGEKAGILRPNGVMVTLPQHPEANDALGEAAVALNVRGVNAATYVPSRDQTEHSSTHNRYPLVVMQELIEVDSPLAGAHQQRNLALAIATAAELRNNYSYNITPDSIARGIRHTVWPARLEQIPGNGQRANVLLDVGHNPAGAWALRAAVSQIDDGKPMTVVFGCLNDKPVRELAQILFPLFGHVIVTPLDSPRSTPVEVLAAAGAETGADVRTAQNPEEALKLAFELTPSEGLIVVTGSLFLVGQLREKLASPPFAATETIRA
jgi:dihydrofolate synthase/folylpolyglutamate synthase